MKAGGGGAGQWGNRGDESGEKRDCNHVILVRLFLSRGGIGGGGSSRLFFLIAPLILCVCIVCRLFPRLQQLTHIQVLL